MVANIIIAVTVAGIIFLAFLKLYRDKKRGKGCTSCSSCPVNSGCSSSSYDFMKEKN